MLHDIAPRHSPLRVLAQGRQRHAEVAGWKDRELGAQPARGTAVVRDGHHCGEITGEVAQRVKTR